MLMLSCHIFIILLAIGLQKQYCVAKNKIPKYRTELYEEQVNNNAILKINCKSETLKIKLLAPRQRTCDEPLDLLANDR